ncbi:baseplate J/gp47 family protein [Phormidesmis sp. 146-35]
MKPPTIDYTNLDYESMRAAMLALARESLPEWTDFSESDLGVLLIDLFAYACDITLYYQNRIASNLLPATSDEPEALTQLLRLIGYELRPPTPATAALRIAVNATERTPISIPARTQFFVELATRQQIVFETETDLQIANNQLTPADPATNWRYFSPLLVIQGQSELNEVVARSNGSPNQMYSLSKPQIISGSIQVTAIEPGGLTFWQEVDTLANSSPADRHFMVQRNAGGSAVIVFGDGTNGLIPLEGTATNPVTLQATYRVGGGVLGNVPTGTRFQARLPMIKDAIALEAAGGGMEGEDLDRARLFAPRLFRTQDRAVTLDDYTDLALQVPGVGKARAIAVNWNQVVMYIAPAGQVAEPSEFLKRDLLAFFENRRMATTSLNIIGPTPADIYLRATVQAQPYFLQTDVQRAVEDALNNYLTFDAIDFGQQIYLSRLYDVIQSLPQVASVFITEFSQTPNSNTLDSNGVIELQPNELPRWGYLQNLRTPPIPPTSIVVNGGTVR